MRAERVIEVIAQFDGAVIEVRHLQRPPEEGAGRKAQVCLAIGAVGLLATAALFVHAYVSRHAGVWVDVTAALALFGGAWLSIEGLVRLAELRRPVGFGLPRGLIDGGEGVYPLVRDNGHGWELTVAPGMEAQFDGVPAPSLVEPGAQAVAIEESTRAWVRLGALSFQVASVAPAARQPRGTLIDWSAQSYTASCALAAGLFLALLFSVPPDPKSLALDDLLVHQRFPTFILKAPLDEPSPIVAAQQKKGGDDKAGKRAAGPGGVMGTPKSKSPSGLYQIKGPPNNTDIHLAKLEANKQAMKSFRDIFGSREDSSIAALWAKDDSALGDAASTVMGGLKGTEVGEAYGVPGGLGIVGDKDGGGGHDHTIGLSNLPTIGRGGQRPGYGGGPIGSIPRDKKVFAKIEPTPGPTRVIGGIDKEIVRRVVHKHLNEVKFCYEQELLKHPELAGRVMTQFTIGSNGVVVASVIQASTLGDPVAEACIAHAVQRWEFPRPDGGGIVIVSYPFALHFAGN